jgi:hypothetical protein
MEVSSMKMRACWAVAVLPFLLLCACSSNPVATKSNLITITTEPIGADVQVNKQPVGRSPAIVDSPAEGTEIVATKGEYVGKTIYKARPQISTIGNDAGASGALEPVLDTDVLVTLGGQLEVGAFKIGSKNAEEDLETALEVLNKLKNPSNTIVIYDASGSMRWPLSETDSTPRFEPAQKALTDFIKKGSPEDFYGLVVFGSRLPSGPANSKQRQMSCGEIELVLPLEKLDKAQMTASITKLGLKDHKGDTPVEQAIRYAADKLKDRAGEKKIILVTDGDDECGGEADRGAREAAKLGIKVYTLAYGIGISKDGKLDEARAEQVRQVLRDCANAGGGLFFDTKGADDLYKAMIKVELDFFNYIVFDKNGKEVLKGRLGQKFPLDPGTYNVVFQTDKPFSKKITVRPAQKTKVFIAITGDRKPEIRNAVQ